MGWWDKIKGAFGGGQEAALEKAVAAIVEKQNAKPKSWAFDPQALAYVYAGETTSDQHPGTAGLDYNTLHAMSRTAFVSAILQTRINQVAEFAVPQPSPYSVGYRVRLRDEVKSPSRAAKKQIAAYERLIQEAGGRYGNGGFEPFIRALTRDSLTYDQGNFEVLWTRGHKPFGFVAVDASTFRRARPSAASVRQGRYSAADMRYVQVVNNQVRAEFAYEELAWGIRRPRTSIYANGYGYPELEDIVRILTALLNALTYNETAFTNGVHASTIIAVKSAMEPQVFSAFQRFVQAMMSGPRNAKRTPFIQLNPDKDEDLKAINLSQSNKDMEYSSFINFMLKLACAIYALDPAELGFVYGNEGQTSSMNQRGPAERIVASKERGLRPLLRSIQSWINEWFMRPLDEDFTFEFAGFDSVTEEQKLKMLVDEVQHVKTLNEARADLNLPRLPGKSGDIVLNSVFLQAWQAENAGGGQGEDLDDTDDEFGGFGGGEGDAGDFGGEAGVGDGESSEAQGFAGAVDTLTARLAQRAQKGTGRAPVQKGAGKHVGNVVAMGELEQLMAKAYRDRLGRLNEAVVGRVREPGL